MLQANQVGSEYPIGTFTVTDNGAQVLSCNSVAVSFSTLLASITNNHKLWEDIDVFFVLKITALTLYNIILYYIIQNRAVSHTSSTPKTSMQAKWTAPASGLSGNIEFRYTFSCVIKCIDL